METPQETATAMFAIGLQERSRAVVFGLPPPLGFAVEVRPGGDNALVGFPARVDPLAVDVDGLRQRVSLGGVELHAYAAPLQ
jgi:hypothetical protein